MKRIYFLLAALLIVRPAYSQTDPKVFQGLLPSNSKILRIDQADLFGVGEKQTIVYYSGFQAVKPVVDDLFKKYQSDFLYARRTMASIYFVVFDQFQGKPRPRSDGFMPYPDLLPESGVYVLDPADPKPYLVILDTRGTECNIALYHADLFAGGDQKRLMNPMQMANGPLLRGGAYYPDEANHILNQRKDGLWVFTLPRGRTFLGSKIPIPNVYQFNKGVMALDNYGNSEFFEPFLSTYGDKLSEIRTMKADAKSDYKIRQARDGAVEAAAASLDIFLYTGHYKEGEKAARELLKIPVFDKYTDSAVRSQVHQFLGTVLLRQGKEGWKKEFGIVSDEGKLGREAGIQKVLGDYYFSILNFTKAKESYEKIGTESQRPYGIPDLISRCKSLLMIQDGYAKKMKANQASGAAK